MSVVWTMKITFAVFYFCNIHLKHAKNLNVMYNKKKKNIRQRSVDKQTLPHVKYIITEITDVDMHKFMIICVVLLYSRF